MYGLIGKKLPHSFSAEIHAMLADYDYKLTELNESEAQEFFAAKNFAAVNVTIPYKKLALEYADEIDETAKEIGAVNTLVNRGGRVYAYNTDYLGLKALIEKNGVCLKSKTVLILGTGGTSLTAKKVAEDMGAKEILRVSRVKKADCIDYNEAYEKYNTAQVIINTTPVGMFPEIDASPVDLDKFSNLSAVFDVVYNPLKTNLVLSARQKGIIAEGGLYMLVAQAIYASEYFLDKKYPPEIFESVYNKVLQNRLNIVLSGMPGSGKSTVGKILSELLKKPLFDTDKEIENNEKTSISEIFKNKSESYFRDLESEEVKKLSLSAEGRIIALGGGAVLRKENILNLKRNGKIYFLDRSPQDIIPTDDRPLALNRAALKKRYEERYGIYKSTCDKLVEVDCDAAGVAQKIRKDYCNEN